MIIFIFENYNIILIIYQNLNVDGALIAQLNLSLNVIEKTFSIDNSFYLIIF